MEKRRLGRTGLMVSALGLGGIGFIGQYRKSKDQALKVINMALDAGVNFIESARAYFDSEEIIGEVMKTRRKECFLATKSYLRSAAQMEKEIERSLSALKTDYIDLYQIHHIQYLYELENVLGPTGSYAALLSAKKEGVIGHIGVTSHNPKILEEVLRTNKFDTVQYPFNPAETEFYEKITPVCKELDIGSIIMKPLCGGRLKSVESALSFILSHDISTVIPGCVTPEQMELDIKIAEEYRSLTGEEKLALSEEIKKLPDQFCRRCRYCEGVCPQELKISDVFRCEEYLILNATYARNEYKSLEKLADACIDCGKCEEICPYNLPVRDMLKRAHGRLSKGKFEDFVVNLVRKIGIYDRVRKLYFDIFRRIPER